MENNRSMVMRSLRIVCVGLVAWAAAPLLAQSFEQTADRTRSYLIAQQEPGGGWSSDLGGIKLPAITGLVVTGLLMDPEIGPTDPAVARGIEFILSTQQPDGGFYDQILPSYNTAICVSALSLARDESQGDRRAMLSEAVEGGVSFLRGLQWGEGAVPGVVAGDAVEAVPPSHPFYGGVGYGRSGRPDNSNLSLWLQALDDAGVPGDDPAVQRALAFIERTQMLDEVNDMDYADGSTQGGFVYATSPSGDELGIGESKAGTIIETDESGNQITRLRSYGSMTYAGLKAYAYAELDVHDPRVVAASEWIASNYTLEENPGIGPEGQYYYYMVFGRAMGAIGNPMLETDRGPKAWADDLVQAVSDLQEDDGSLKTLNDRWMENNPVLTAAYTLIALENARPHVSRSGESNQQD